MAGLIGKHYGLFICYKIYSIKSIYFNILACVKGKESEGELIEIKGMGASCPFQWDNETSENGLGRKEGFQRR